jgi:hypothetical protein
MLTAIVHRLTNKPRERMLGHLDHAAMNNPVTFQAHDVLPRSPVH